MSDLIGVGLIGAGSIGRVHALNIARRVSGARLVAVADPAEAAAKEIGDQLDVPAVYDSADDLLANRAVEAVVVASPASTHAQLLRDVAVACKHVFCEKPLGLDLPAIDSALEAIAQAGVALQVGFQRRFDRNFRQARDLIAEGLIGQPRLVRVISRDPRPPSIQYLRKSGGLFMDMTIHDFDIARFLIADEIEEVTALGAVLVDPAIGREAKDLDTAIIALRYATGALGVIDNCRQAAYGYDQRVEVFGSQGAVLVGNEEMDRTVLITAEGARKASPQPWFGERYADAYLAEMQAFVDAIRGGRRAEVDGKDGRVAVALALAAERSAKERRPVLVSSVEATMVATAPPPPPV